MRLCCLWFSSSMKEKSSWQCDERHEGPGVWHALGSKDPGPAHSEATSTSLTLSLILTLP
jgi:hypothetical protein